MPPQCNAMFDDETERESFEIGKKKKGKKRFIHSLVPAALHFITRYYTEKYPSILLHGDHAKQEEVPLYIFLLSFFSISIPQLKVSFTEMIV